MKNLKNRQQAHEFYGTFLAQAKKEGGISGQKKAAAMLGSNDLFYLLVYVLDRNDVDCDWLFDRCREVQLEPNGYIDLWAREHRKSTIITYALTLQDIINDVEIRMAIFSLTKKEAKKFGREIKEANENNSKLHELWPEVFWEEPQTETRKAGKLWSLDEGLHFKRKGVYKEATVEFWGLDSMPTGRHFQIRIYDDVITERDVTNPEMLEKSLAGWRLSANLGSDQPVKHYKGVNHRRIIGTRYHQNDTYGQLLRDNIATPRIYPATDTGRPDGNSVFFPQGLLIEKRKEMGPYVFGTQMLQNPQADEVEGFLESWLVYWSAAEWNHLNRYLLVDPAGEKKKENDYTVMLVVGLGEDNNYYLIDGVRDRMNLTQRAETLFRLHRKYNPIKTGYEKYGMQSDVEHIQYIMERDHYRFTIDETGGNIPKKDRIRKLIPLWEQGRVFLPFRCDFVDYEKKQRNLVQELINDEFIFFPVGTHDDILDCFARIVDSNFGAEFPMTKTQTRHAALYEKAKTDYDIWENA